MQKDLLMGELRMEETLAKQCWEMGILQEVESQSSGSLTEARQRRDSPERREAGPY